MPREIASPTALPSQEDARESFDPDELLLFARTTPASRPANELRGGEIFRRVRGKASACPSRWDAEGVYGGRVDRISSCRTGAHRQGVNLRGRRGGGLLR